MREDRACLEASVRTRALRRIAAYWLVPLDLPTVALLEVDWALPHLSVKTMPHRLVYGPD